MTSAYLDYINYILSKKSNYKGILVDTNLLLLLFVGLFDKNQIESFKRISKYSYEDFCKLSRLIDFFSNKIFITPNILTEVCNLTDSLKKQDLFFRFMGKMITALNLNEHLEKSVDLMKNNQVAFYKFDIADTSIINLANQNILIITDDFGVYHFLNKKGLDAINYTHLINWTL